MPVYRSCLSILAASLALVGGVIAPLCARRAVAQEPQASRKSPTRVDMTPYLERLQYNAGERGPLVVVVPPDGFTIKRELPPLDGPGATPLMLADASDRRVFKAGTVTVIAPREMTLLNTKPGKANPLLDLPPEQRLAVLLGTLSEAQWKTVGSAGLSQNDLTDDQAALMDGVWPRFTSVRQTRAKANPEKPNEPTFEDVGDPVPVDASRLRLRLSRVAMYTFNRPGDDNTQYITRFKRAPRDGEVLWDGDVPPSDTTSTFGVALRAVVPALLKRGELDFADPAFDAPVPLARANGTAIKTVEGLMNNVRAATNLDIRADRRVGDLPLYVRARVGQTARAGDLLMAVAYGVTGAYRRLDARLFLLTDDMEGIGTRWARLADWADRASAERTEIIARLGAEAAKHKPLRYLPFSAGYNSLPDNIAAKIEKGWDKNKYSHGVGYSIADLPPAVRQDAERTRQMWESMDEPIPMRRDKVVVGMGVKVQWVLPDGGYIDSLLGLDNMEAQFLASTPPEPEPVASPPPALAASHSPLDPRVKRRGVAIAPKNAVEASLLVRTAKARGFNEVWVRHTPGSDLSPLQEAIRTANVAKVACWVMPTLLKGSAGIPERTVAGQTGDEWATAFLSRPQFAAKPDMKTFALQQTALCRGWMAPQTGDDEEALRQQIVLLARLTGIAGICVTHTTPPGTVRSRGRPSLVPVGGDVGYTRAARLSFLLGEGVDPIDLTLDDGVLDADRSLPFVKNDAGLNDKWLHFQDGQVRERLRKLHKVLQAAQPQLPLYIEDRTSSYASYPPPQLSWFGSWDKADRLPTNMVLSTEGEAFAAARAGSDTRLLRIQWNGFLKPPADVPGFRSLLERASRQSLTPPQQWQGIVLDLTTITAGDAARLLGSLPAPGSAPKAGKTRPRQEP